MLENHAPSVYDECKPVQKNSENQLRIFSPFSLKCCGRINSNLPTWLQMRVSSQLSDSGFLHENDIFNNSLYSFEWPGRTRPATNY